MRSNPFNPTQGITVTNGSGSDIPPRSVVVITGVTKTAATTTQEVEYVYTVNQWNNVRKGDVVVTGPTTIASGQRGSAYYDPLIYVAFDNSVAVPTVGEMWGPVKNSWKLKRGGVGFFCTGIVDTDAAPVMAVFRRSEVYKIYAKSTGAIGAGSLSSPTAFTFNFWVPDISSGATPKPSIVSPDADLLGITGYNRDSTLSSSGATLLRVEWNQEYGEWTIVGAAC